jgi:hypothetical protein
LLAGQRCGKAVRHQPECTVSILEFLAVTQEQRLRRHVHLG